MSRHYGARQIESRYGTLTASSGTVSLVLALLMVVASTGLAQAQPQGIPPGHSTETLQVKLEEGLQAGKIHSILPQQLRTQVTRIRPLFSVSPRQLGRLKAEGERRLGRRVKDLTLWFEFRLRPGVDGAAFLAGLRQVQGIEHAEPAPLPAPSPAVTPSFVDDQGYLDPATDGIDAEFSWTIAGGSGAGVAIYDVEYSWNQGHEDLTKAASVSLLLDGGDSAVDPFADNNHGTAVLGELIADNKPVAR